MILLLTLFISYTDPIVLPFDDFDQPTAIKTHDSRLFVLNRGNHQVVCLNPKGDVLWRYGRKGQGPGELMNPNDIAVNQAGELLIGDWANQNITIVDTNGAYKAQYPIPTMRTGFLLVRANGNLVLSESTGLYFFFKIGGEQSAKPLLWEFNPKGEKQAEYGSYVHNKEPLLGAHLNQGYPCEIDGKLYYTTATSNETLVFDGKREKRFPNPIRFQPPEPTVSTTKEVVDGKTTFYSKAEIFPTIAYADAAPDGRLVLARYSKAEKASPVDITTYDLETQAKTILIKEIPGFIRLTVDRKNGVIYYLHETDEDWSLSYLKAW